MPNPFGDEPDTQGANPFGDHPDTAGANPFGDKPDMGYAGQSAKFQQDAGVQSAADQHVRDKWAEYGAIAGQSQGQAIRDHAKAAYGLDATPSAIPALDYRPEHDPVMQASYVRNQLASQPGGLDRVKQLEDRWRQDYLNGALFNANQTAMNAPTRPAPPEDVGIAHGAVDSVLRSAAHAVTDNVQSGTELYYALGNYDANDHLHGATANPTPMQLERDASLGTVANWQQNIDGAYPQSTNAANGGWAKTLEDLLGAGTQIALVGGGLKAGGLQKGLALTQMGGQIFGNSYAEQYKAGLSQGLTDSDASRNALIGGLADAAANTYLMKFGVVGELGSTAAVTKVRQVAAMALKDAIAQGLVGGSQQTMSEATKFLATGEGGNVKNILDAAVANAKLGAAFGAIHGAAGYRGGANPFGDHPDQTNPGEVSAPGRSGGDASIPVPDATALKNAMINPESNGPNQSGGVNSPGGGADVPGAVPTGGLVDQSAPADSNLSTPLLDKAPTNHRANLPDGTADVVPVDFADKNDKALYAATSARQGRVSAEARTHLTAQGYDEARIADEGQKLRDHVKGLYDATPDAERLAVAKPEDRTNAEAPNEPAPVSASPDVVDGERGRPASGGPARTLAEATRPGGEDATGRPRDDATGGERGASGDIRQSPLDDSSEPRRVGVDESQVEETRYGSAYHDLTHDEIRRLAAVSGENAVRGMHNPETGATVWWGADKAGHHDMARVLGWPEPSDRNSLEAQIKGNRVWVHRGGEGKNPAFDAVTKRTNTPEYMKSPAGDGYRSEMARLGGEAQAERDQAAARIREKSGAALDRMGQRIPTPDAPATKPELASALRDLKRSYPDTKVYKPDNRDQVGMADLIERATGRKVLYVGGDKEPLPFKGVVHNDHPAALFVHTDLGGAELRKTAWHELFHTFQQQNPELADQIHEMFPKEVRDKVLGDYVSRAEKSNSDGYADRLKANPEHLRSELGASLFEGLTNNPRIMESLTGEQKGVLGRVVDWFRKVFGVGDKPLTPFERKMKGYVDTVAEALRTGDKGGPEAEPEKLAASKVSQAPLGADKFVKDDVVDRAKDVWDGLGKAFDGVRRWFAPQTRGPQAERAADIMRGSNAERAQKADQIEHAFWQTKLAMDKLPTATTRDFIDGMDRGRPQTNPALQPVADAVKTVFDDRLHTIQGLGTGKLTEFIEHYFPHNFTDPKAAAATVAQINARRPWEGNKGFLKQRKYATLADAMAANPALKLVTENPIEAMVNYTRQADKYITAQRAFAEMKAKGLAVKVAARDVGKWRSKGYDQIDDNIATIFAKPNRKGGLSIAGYWMAPEPVATVMNNHLQPGLGSDPYLGKAYRGWMTTGNVLNQVQLGLSPFHALFVTVDSAVGRMAMGLQELAKGNWKDGATAAASAMTVVHPAYENVQNGRLMRQEWLTPGSTGRTDIAAAVNYAKMSGARMFTDSVYKTGMTDKMMQAFRQGNIIGGALRSPFAGIETVAKPILEKLVPMMKAGAYYDMIRRQITPGMTADEQVKVGRKAWDSVENRLGEMTYDNLFWNRTAKDMAMATTRAVGWNLGTIRELGGGTLDAGKALARVAQGKRPELTNQLAYTIALPLLTGVLGGVTHRLLTGKNPDELKDYYFPRTGELDKSGRPVRIQMPGYMADVWKYSKDIHTAERDEKPLAAFTTLSHKTHPLLNLTLEMLRNEDYYGDQIRNVNDPYVQQLLQTAKHVGGSLVPFDIKDAVKLHSEGQGMKSLLPLAGITRARTDITRSDAENRAAEFAGQSHSGGRTPEQAEHGQAVRDFSDALRRGQPDAGEQIRQAASHGTLNAGDLKRIQQDQRTPGLLERTVSRLDPEQAVKVWDVATPDERRRIGAAVLKRVRSSSTLDPERRAELISRLQSDWNALQSGEGK